VWNRWLRVKSICGLVYTQNFEALVSINGVDLTYCYLLRGMNLRKQWDLALPTPGLEEATRFDFILPMVSLP
jgi:hypothetical protein